MHDIETDVCTYTPKIISAIKCFYASNAAIGNVDLMRLYTFIGKCICRQGEKSFVIQLSQHIAEYVPSSKGFSARNLRRMRNFYQSYRDEPFCMQLAMQLCWTQNVVILEKCVNNEQRAFYMTHAIDNTLSKLSLVQAIESNLFFLQNGNDTDICYTSDSDRQSSVPTTSNGVGISNPSLPDRVGEFCVPACFFFLRSQVHLAPYRFTLRPLQILLPRPP